MSRWPKQMKRLRDERGNQCEFVESNDGRCYEREELQFAHIKPTGLSGQGRGQSRRVMDIKQNPECYKLYCKFHHQMFDRNYWRYQK